jgi:signal transduction histidine kinase
MGLAAALEWGAEDFQTRTGTKCEISLPDIDIRLDAERATALFRIFQETLTNVTRHAGATQVQVRLTKENAGLILEVRDNGRGMRDDQLSGKSSLGILGMRERVLLLGGTLTISSTLGSGTTVRVEIPDSNISR